MADEFVCELDAHIAESMKDPEYAYFAGVAAVRQAVQEVLDQHWDWKAGRSLHDAMRAVAEADYPPAESEAGR